MSDSFALCIRCGDWKRAALTPCKRCGFLPQADEDIAKSLVLGPPHTYELDGEVIEAGHLTTDLERIREQIMDGRSFDYVDSDLAALSKMYREFSANRPWSMVLAILWWILPVVLCLAGLLVFR